MASDEKFRAYLSRAAAELTQARQQLRDLEERLHEPGDQIVLGKHYPDTGIDQGRAVLADLARHPATAQHIAQKLAQHFVADEPPPTLVVKLTKAFKDSDGNLKEVAKTLITAVQVRLDLGGRSP